MEILCNEAYAFYIQSHLSLLDALALKVVCKRSVHLYWKGSELQERVREYYNQWNFLERPNTDVLMGDKLLNHLSTDWLSGSSVLHFLTWTPNEGSSETWTPDDIDVYRKGKSNVDGVMTLSKKALQSEYKDLFHEGGRYSLFTCYEALNQKKRFQVIACSDPYHQIADFDYSLVRNWIHESGKGLTLHVHDTEGLLHRRGVFNATQREDRMLLKCEERVFKYLKRGYTPDWEDDDYNITFDIKRRKKYTRLKMSTPPRITARNSAWWVIQVGSSFEIINPLDLFFALSEAFVLVERVSFTLRFQGNEIINLLELPSEVVFFEFAGAQIQGFPPRDNRVRDIVVLARDVRGFEAEWRFQGRFTAEFQGSLLANDVVPSNALDNTFGVRYLVGEGNDLVQLIELSTNEATRAFTSRELALFEFDLERTIVEFGATRVGTRRADEAFDDALDDPATRQRLI